MNHQSDLQMQLSELRDTALNIKTSAQNMNKEDLADAVLYITRCIDKAIEIESSSNHINVDSDQIEIDELHRYKLKGDTEWSYYSSRAREFFEKGVTFNIEGLTQEDLTKHLAEKICKQSS